MRYWYLLSWVGKFQTHLLSLKSEVWNAVGKKLGEKNKKKYTMIAGNIIKKCYAQMQMYLSVPKSHFFVADSN